MFSVCVYDNYEDKNLIINYKTNNISFSTKVPGGFDSSQIELPIIKNLPLNFWISKHVEIYDRYGDIAFEGLLENPRTSDEKVTVDVNGYYVTGDRISAGPIYFSGQYKGALVSVSINAGGTGYSRGDYVTVSGGTNGQLYVDEVDDSGVVSAVYLSSYGYGYSVTTGASTSGGSGSGLTVDIGSVETGSTSYDISKFMADLNPYWRDNFSFIDQLDRVPVGPLVFTRADKINSALEEASKYGYLDNDNYSPPKRRQLYYAVYEDRVLQMRRNPDIRIDNPEWVISIENIKDAQPLTMKVSGSDIGNRLWVEYNDPDVDGNSFTLGVSDRNSIEKYGVREHVQSIGEASVDVAEVVEELLLEYKTEPTYSSTVKVIGKVQGIRGATHPVWKIRAGDLVRISDIDVGLENLSGSRLSAITFVTQTKYDHNNRTMNLTLGTGNRLDLMLKRLGV